MVTGDKASWLLGRAEMREIAARHGVQYIKPQGMAAISAITRQQMVRCFERVQPIVDGLIEMVEHGDYSNGNTANGLDEGDVLARSRLDELKSAWRKIMLDRLAPVK